MKTKTIIFILLSIVYTNINAQNNTLNRFNVDTTNLLKPEIFNIGCLDGLNFSEEILYNSWINIQAIVDDNDSVNVIAYAQPMYADTLTAFKSMVYLSQIPMVDLMKVHPYTNGYYPDSNYTYFQIWDSTLTNLIYQINYYSVYKNEVINSSSINFAGSIQFREIVFDSSIVLRGKFYIVQTFDPLYRLERMISYDSKYFKGGLELLSILKPICEEYDEKYSHEMLKLEGSSEWIYPEDIDTTNFTTDVNYLWVSHCRPIRALLVFPKIDTAFDWATWNAQNSALNEIQERERQINVFPNPAKDKITIESATELESIEIKNILGITQKSLKVKGSKVIVPISDLEKGTYLVSIRTSEGNHTKKIVKE